MQVILLIITIVSLLLLVGSVIFLANRFRWGRRDLPPTAVAVEKGETASVRYLKERCRLLEQRDIERKLYLEVAKVLSTVTSFDDLARGSIEAICSHLHASRGALMWIPADGQTLQFRYSVGYDEISQVTLPLQASLAGASLLKGESSFVVSPWKQIQYVPIGTVVESNVLFSPVKMFRDYRGVLRISNIDTTLLDPARIAPLFTQLTPLLSSALEKVLIAQENERRKNELAAISGVTQALSRTLDIREICAACARHLKPIFNYTYFMVVRIGPDETTTSIVALPREIRFNDSEASSKIILRNLCNRREPTLIEDVRRSDIVKSQNREIGSLIVMPIVISNQHFGAMILSTAETGSLEVSDMAIVATIAEHLAVTIERAVYFRKQEEDASRDGLTGLYNRRSFQERLRTEHLRFMRYKRPCSLVMIDIDHFKKVNDQHGHQTGDQILRAVSDIIAASIRTVDAAFRYGGEELAILLPETSLEQAALFACRLCARIAAQKHTAPSGEFRVTVSMGVAQADESDGAEIEGIIRGADKALYSAKTSGRNGVCIFKNGKSEKISIGAIPAPK